MRSLSRGGFALMELLLATVLLALFAGALVMVLRGAGRIATRSGRLLLADRALLALRTFAQEELRDATTGDVALVSASRIALSRPIGEGMACADSGGVVLIADSAWTGTRTPAAARDDLLLLISPAAATWLAVPIDSVGRGRCPLDNAPAVRLDVPPHAGAGTFARVMEGVELSAYASGGADWFGLTPASGSSSVQPFAGPLALSATRFSVTSSALDILVPPRGASSSVVQIPLGAP